MTTMSHCTRRTLIRQGLLAAGGMSAGLAFGTGLSTRILKARAETTSPYDAIATTQAITSALLAANLDFSFRLQNTLLKNGLAENLFFSPLSISTALDMLYNGAASTTGQAMAAALGLKTLRPADVNTAALGLLNELRRRDPKITLSIADSIWLRNGVVAMPNFVTALQTYYGAVLRNLDFSNPQAPATINAWINQQTYGLIPSIVKTIDPSTVMYLINALYLKAPWSSPFSATETRPDTFTTDAGKAIIVSMMSQEGTFSYAKTDTLEVIRLPYGAQKMSMYIVLPAKTSSLKALLSGLNAARWNALLQNLKPQHGSIQLPKFTVTYEADLKPVLTALGMGQAFDPLRATFAGIVQHPHVFVSEAKQKAIIKVDENGTVAAAVTSIGVSPTVAMENLFTMVVNRPFFCAIRDDVTGTLLFMGSIVNPSLG
jgi:serine protease inhibitor